MTLENNLNISVPTKLCSFSKKRRIYLRNLDYLEKFKEFRRFRKG